MRVLSKSLILLLLGVLVIPGVILISTVNAQSISKPSVPEFTVKYVDRSYDESPTYGVDPLTGQRIVRDSGYHVPRHDVDITINNQPFTPYPDSTGNYTRLYYNVRFKGHYEDQWRYGQETKYYGYYGASNTDSTVITIHLDQFYGSSLNAVGMNQTVSSIQLDVQLEALIGIDYMMTIPTGLGPSNYWEFVGQSSGYSNIHTIDLDTNAVTTVPNTSSAAYTIQEFTSSPTANPYVSSTPTVPEFSWLIVVPLLLSAFAVSVIAKHRKTH